MPPGNRRTRPIRIAHVLAHPDVGGGERATLNIASGLEGSDFRSTVFCVGGAAGIAGFFKESGLDTVSCFSAEPSFRRPAPFIRSCRRIASLLRERQIDIMHCSDVRSAELTSAAGALARVPVICHVRNRYDSLPRLEKFFLAPVRSYVFVSQATWRQFDVQVPGNRGRVIYDGIEIPPTRSAAGDAAARDCICHEFGIPNDATIIGSVARVAPQKDYETLARAAACVVRSNPKVRFLVVGQCSGTYRSHFRSVRDLINQLGLAEYFTFTDYRQDVQRILRGLDIFVLSTHIEGFPLSILEAMANGRPVIATGVDGIPEIVSDGETGLLFEHCDHAGLADRILLLAGNRSYAGNLAEAGLARVRDRFTHEQFLKEMRGMYLSMADPSLEVDALEARSLTTRDQLPTIRGRS